MLNNDINFLMGKIRNLESTEENQRRNSVWEPITNTAEAYWHGRPREGLSFIPFTIEPEHEMWGKIIGFNLDEYYNNGSTYLLADLNMKIYRFENFCDDTPIGRTVSMWLGAGFEASLFGMNQKFTPDKDPWLGREPILKDTKNLDILPEPDFYNSPVMETVHLMYEGMKSMVSEDFCIVMPEWCRGPFGLACHLRGMDKITIDMIEDPKFVHDLMRFTTDARKKWTKQRADFMRVDIQPGSLYNDEVNVPLLSPNFYEKYVLPYEIELSEFYGGITYWHSCGNIVPLQKLIQNIPNLEMVHISPWSDLRKSVENFKDTDIALEVVLHPLEDVQNASPDQIKARLTSIRSLAQGLSATVRADGLQNITTIEDDIAKIKLWGKIARDILIN